MTGEQLDKIFDTALYERRYRAGFAKDEQDNVTCAYLYINFFDLNPFVTAIVVFDLLTGRSPSISFVFEGEKKYTLRDLDYITCLVESIADRIDAEITEADFADFKERMCKYE